MRGFAKRLELNDGGLVMIAFGPGARVILRSC